jgi:hypothetical protein
MPQAVGILAIMCILWGIVSMIAITDYLYKKGRKINFFLIRLLIINYVHDYQKMTIQEQGKPGFWYYSFISSILSALVLASITIILLKV